MKICTCAQVANEDSKGDHPQSQKPHFIHDAIYYGLNKCGLGLAFVGLDLIWMVNLGIKS